MQVTWTSLQFYAFNLRRNLGSSTFKLLLPFVTHQTLFFNYTCKLFLPFITFRNLFLNYFKAIVITIVHSQIYHSCHFASTKVIMWSERLTTWCFVKRNWRHKMGACLNWFHSVPFCSGFYNYPLKIVLVWMYVCVFVCMATPKAINN